MITNGILISKLYLRLTEDTFKIQFMIHKWEKTYVWVRISKGKDYDFCLRYDKVILSTGSWQKIDSHYKLSD